jgi:ADP-heptose:LPS heptosyltransferase
MNILVVRFRQMGDAILTTVVLNSLKKRFSDCSIDFVLNDKICPLVKGHPSINRLIPFKDEERHSFFEYIRKVWHVVHSTHYDVIIDMRSTMNTMLFALFSPSTPYRIGLNKGYCKLAFNHLIERSCAGRSMIEFNLSMLKPLEKEGKLIRDEHCHGLL